MRFFCAPSDSSVVTATRRPRGRSTLVTATALAVAGAIAGTVIGASPASAGGPPVKLPSHGKGLKAPVALPSQLDPVPSYQPQTSCQPIEKPGITKLKNLLMSTYKVGYAGRSAATCTDGLSEHSEGRAFDWMVNTAVPREKKAAADFIQWATRDNGRNARRMGVMYLIYNQKIWGAYRASDGWRPSAGHLDHVHISMTWNGARGRTSFWSGKVQSFDYGPCVLFAGQYAPVRNHVNSKPCAGQVKVPQTTKHAVRQFGSSGAEVKTAQKLLKIRQSGSFDYPTRDAVVRWQKEHGLAVTGVMDQMTWATLDPGSITSSVVKGVSPTLAAARGLAHYSRTSLSRGSAGTPVILLQRALNSPRSDLSGYYDAPTITRVKAMQKKLGLSQTGRWTKADWTALARPTT